MEDKEKRSMRMLLTIFKIMLTITCAIVLAIVIYLGCSMIFSVSIGENIPKESRASAKAVEVVDYFVSTNEVYTENHQTSLADMALAMNFYDFDQLIADSFAQSATCTPIEAMDGSTTYDYSFQSEHWQVELFTLIDNEDCSITSWIDIYKSDDDSICYEYQSVPAKLKPANYVTNLSKIGENGSTHLFVFGRQAFADFLVLMEAGSLNQKYAIPFDLVGIPYETYTTTPSPAT